ncbi:Zinc carboxypeptidase [Fodinibius roseus]|uniref:Zinc carboxypeptidase n=1 Tax=Fodinibius roseus TaxID=1194090 RepID=A0A1M4V0N6_9BACT|nr:M14 family metallopeptidase [Fodinibius roseus]SHE62489.1 Zinc carboxypeptidase [Fodinibius roseus]
MPSSRFFWFLLLVFLMFQSCKSSEEFTGYSYDPEGVTNTADKEIQFQYSRTIGVAAEGIWISNEFEGARMNDFYRVSDSLYRAVIEPENHPINNSPWYSFKMHSNSPTTINLQLSYKHGKHRYLPKLSRDGKRWTRIDSSDIREDTSGTATLTLDLNKNPLWISAQELLTYRDMVAWMDSISTATPTQLDTVGYSHQQRPVIKMTIGSAPPDHKQGVLVITGRQHPPEVTGGLASRAFIEALTADTELAGTFRKEFEIWSYPLVNPDGVAEGHWRHNGAGIDLNRDWKNFNQPETRAIRDDLLPINERPERRVYYGIDFHSTKSNIFYPIKRDISTFPEDFTYRWIEPLQEQFPETPFNVEPFDTNSPIAKNWIYQTFGADAVTYEVDDRADRQKLKEVSRQAAQIIMRHLLAEKKKRP